MVHMILASHLQRLGLPAPPLAVHAALAGGRLASALLQLVAHRGPAELARHAQLARAALEVAAWLAGAPGLRGLLTQRLRFSNEETSLAQVRAQRPGAGVAGRERLRSERSVCRTQGRHGTPAGMQLTAATRSASPACLAGRPWWKAQA